MHLPAAEGRHVRIVQVLCMMPGDFSLGSSQSRAAARADLERRNAARKRVDFVLQSSVPRSRGDGITIRDWCEAADGMLTRFSIIPSGMTLEQAERIAAQRS